jgi:glycosyltransferase involved in cell wall biosynthesis
VALAAARLSARRAARRTPVVVVEVSTLRTIVAQSGLARDRLLPSLAGRLYPSAAAVVTGGRGVADDLAAACPRLAGRIEILAGPIVSSRVLQGARGPVDDDWFAPGRPPVVLAVARLVPEKDLATLLTAFARVRSRRGARLLVVGEGPQRASLEAMAADLGLVLGTDVRFPGADANPYRFMARAAVVVLSSRTEGVPAVLIEALALGAAVVSTDCRSGPREILDGGRFGRLVAVGDADALAGAIDDVLARPQPPAPREAWARWEAGSAVRAYHDLLRAVWRDDTTSRQSRS